MKKFLAYLSIPMLLVVLALGVQLSFGAATVSAGQDPAAPTCTECVTEYDACLAKAKSSVDVAKCEVKFQECTAKCKAGKP